MGPNLIASCSWSLVSREPSGLYGRAKGGVIPFVLVGVGHGEVGDRPIETVAPSEVGSDLYAVSGAGVSSGKCPAAEASVEDQLVRRHGLDLRRALHVLELAPVEVASFRATEPAEEDIARGLHQPLAGHDAMTVVLVGTRRNVALQYRGPRLFDLEEQGIIPVTTFLAASTKRYLSSRWRRSSCKVRL